MSCSSNSSSPRVLGHERDCIWLCWSMCSGHLTSVCFFHDFLLRFSSVLSVVVFYGVVVFFSLLLLQVLVLLLILDTSLLKVSLNFFWKHGFFPFLKIFCASSGYRFSLFKHLGLRCHTTLLKFLFPISVVLLVTCTSSHFS